jgi:GxxExxY protein
MDINSITDKIIGAAIKVHSVLGPGLLESMYEKCMALELTKTELHFECQAPIHVIYDGKKVGHGYYVDILVEQSVVVEIKTVDRFHPIHTAQILSYLKLMGCKVGLLINFHVYSLPQGIKRVVLQYDGAVPRFPRFPR